MFIHKLLACISTIFKEHLLFASTQVLSMLAGLTEYIMALLGFFKRMNVAIEEIINESESAMLSIAEDAAAGVELSQVDYEVS
jgi:hypothetical protein